MSATVLSQPDKPVDFDPINALSALPFAVLAVDEDSRIAFMNGAAEQFFEQGARGLRGRQLNELLPADSPLFSLIAQASSGQTSVAEYDVSISFPKTRPRKPRYHGGADDGRIVVDRCVAARAIDRTADQ